MKNFLTCEEAYEKVLKIDAIGQIIVADGGMSLMGHESISTLLN